jgi:hypothetical protein
MLKIGADVQKAGGMMKGGFQRALDETQKGLQKVAQVPDLLAPKAGSQQQQSQDSGLQQLYPHPPLAALFAARAAAGASASQTQHHQPAVGAPSSAAADSSGMPRLQASPLNVIGPVPALAGGRGARSSDPTSSRSGASRAHAQPLTPQAAARDDAAQRPELFVGETRGSGAGSGTARLAPAAGGGAAASAGPALAPTGTSGPRVRTAAEIRQAYGRAPLNMTQVRVAVGLGALCLLPVARCSLGRAFQSTTLPLLLAHRALPA